MANPGGRDCRACAKIASDQQWRSLPLVRSMGASELAAFMTGRSTRAIEIRACVRCGRRMARLADGAARTGAWEQRPAATP